MDTRKAHQSEIDELRAKKETILSMFETYEKQIDNRIAQMADDAETVKPSKTTGSDLTFDADDIFERAVERSRQRTDTRFKTQTERPKHPVIELADTAELSVRDAAEKKQLTEEEPVWETEEAQTLTNVVLEEPEEVTAQATAPQEATDLETVAVKAETLLETEVKTPSEAEAPDDKADISEEESALEDEAPIAEENVPQADDHATPEPEKTAFDAFFEDFGEEEDTPFLPEKEEDAPQMQATQVFEPVEPVKVASEPIDLSAGEPADTVVLPTQDELWESEGTLTGVAHPDTVAAFYSAQKEDEAFYKNDFDENPLPQDEEEEEVENDGLEDVRYDNVDGESLRAFKFSSVGFRMALFVVAMMLTGAFGIAFGASLTKIDYLILFVICLFTVLTVDMSFNASLIVSGVILIGCFISFVVDIFRGESLELFRLCWFVLGLWPS